MSFTNFKEKDDIVPKKVYFKKLNLFLSLLLFSNNNIEHYY